ncbi:UDP-GlcNAc:undecaprenyl-phosphate GlcNAc-1-phosphate transferase [Allocatelliglobosispora scoriae]|uniref:UDP-GlcNAc:undecaprenyl-phosphate GlcNAc-1-phosphate transferase n=1 Tax=Allocatelliglobosispora scoriae TaxID=643052 RepID=A0A841BVL9_9ACTN|nr:MraY family glycosyltransferase [Allocatelliglobosispora scoriae]MBB5870812.1 UDP-GlcNAc:undecaprenyl-phosphate GlcNAc-1-phosphate transferase [Allocatelliglobosispora scoriae]
MSVGFCALVSFVCALIGTEVIRRFALARGITDRPAAHKSHRAPTPLLGGVAVASAAVAAVVLTGSARDTATLAILAAGVVLSVLGLVDDLYPLGPGFRLIVEGCVAAGIVQAGVVAPVTGAGWLDAALTVVWLVLITNAMNLLDNTDGILAVVSLVTGVAVALAGGGVIALAAAGAALGFLCHNRPPARIFLGDSGSLFLGIVLAASAVRVSSALPIGAAPVAYLLLAMLPATADTLIVIVSRRRAKRSVLLGGVDHLAHRLRRAGLSPWGTVLAFGVGCGGASGLGWLVAEGALGGVWALSGGVVAVSVLVVGAQRVRCYDGAGVTAPMQGQPRDAVAVAVGAGREG